MTTPVAVRKALEAHIRELHLPGVREHYSSLATIADKESWSPQRYLLEVLKKERESRWNNKIRRLAKASRLPPEKTKETFNFRRLPLPLRRHVDVLMEGGFLSRKENVLCFGRPGSGKTHLLQAIAWEQVHHGKSVYSDSCNLLLQELLAAKAAFKLPAVIRRLTRHDALVLDDIGYVQQGREEMEVLFTLLAECYERTSLLITSNLAFSKWETIFKDPMTTAAAIDRLVHHSVILEMNLPSYRVEEAKKKKGGKPQNQTKNGEF